MQLHITKRDHKERSGARASLLALYVGVFTDVFVGIISHLESLYLHVCVFTDVFVGIISRPNRVPTFRWVGYTVILVLLMGLLILLVELGLVIS